eukprot:364487-Chlamydomonas_euryale.AAC.28
MQEPAAGAGVSGTGPSLRVPMLQAGKKRGDQPAPRGPSQTEHNSVRLCPPSSIPSQATLPRGEHVALTSQPTWGAALATQPASQPRPPTRTMAPGHAYCPSHAAVAAASSASQLGHGFHQPDGACRVSRFHTFTPAHSRLLPERLALARSLPSRRAYKFI